MFNRIVLFVIVTTFASGCFPRLGPALQASWCSETNSWGSCVEPLHHPGAYHPVGCNVYPGDFPESSDTRQWQYEAARLFHPETIPDTPECREVERRRSYDHLRLSEDGSNAQAMRRSQ